MGYRGGNDSKSFPPEAFNIAKLFHPYIIVNILFHLGIFYNIVRQIPYNSYQTMLLLTRNQVACGSSPGGGGILFPFFGPLIVSLSVRVSKGCKHKSPRGPQLFTILYSLLEILTKNLQSLALYDL